jgi:IS30 family transposase
VHRQSRLWSLAWSPEQIAERLKVDFPKDPTMRISHDAIYQALYIQGRGALKRELSACLRSGWALRLPRDRARNRGKSFISDALMISDRPAEIEDRVVPGHSLPGRAVRSNVPRGGRATVFSALAVRRSAP